MNWEKFKENFHESWHLKMQPFIESDACNNIYKYLKAESQRGKQIAPLSSNVYRCFKETPLNEIKVVMLGMCPYHSLKNGEPVADGLLMGCSTTGILPLFGNISAFVSCLGNTLSLPNIKGSLLSITSP